MNISLVDAAAIADKALEEKALHEKCLEARICPKDGTPLVLEWLEEVTGWYGSKRIKKVNGYDGHELHPFYAMQCPHCGTIYTIWN